MEIRTRSMGSRPRLALGAVAMFSVAMVALAGAPELIAEGESALRVGNLIGALRAFRAALGEDPGSWQARDGMGRAFQASGDLDSAERELRGAVEMAPTERRPARDLADLLLSRADPERQRQGLAWLAARAAGSADIQLLVARHARRSGDFVTAVAALERLRSLRPDSKEAMVEEIQLYQDALAYDRAEVLSLEFIERYPSYHQTHVQLAGIYRRQGRNEEAEEHYRLGLDLRPEDPTALTRLGELRMEVGDLEEALNLLERATLVRPENHQAFYLLGRVHLLRGEREAAEVAMQRFQELKDALRAKARLAGGAVMVDE